MKRPSARRILGFAILAAAVCAGAFASWRVRREAKPDWSTADAAWAAYSAKLLEGFNSRQTANGPKFEPFYQIRFFSPELERLFPDWRFQAIVSKAPFPPMGDVLFAVSAEGKIVGLGTSEWFLCARALPDDPVACEAPKLEEFFVRAKLEINDVADAERVAKALDQISEIESLARSRPRSDSINCDHKRRYRSMRDGDSWLSEAGEMWRYKLSIDPERRLQKIVRSAGFSAIWDAQSGSQDDGSEKPLS